MADSRVGWEAEIQIETLAAPKPWNQTDAAAFAKKQDKQQIDDIMAYVEAPLPGQPGAPEDMVEGDDEEDL